MTRGFTKKSVQACISVLYASIVPFPTLFMFDFGIVPTG